ncbi:MULTISPECIES: hypothetical protein [unclassified Clostridium]|uniref:hypothetical protein n=1 Tax=unclassified Clostridium TaxID=2614128 RepID=UPI003217E558
MSSIMDTIASETNGKSFKTFKYGFEGIDVPTFDYDDNKEITWEKFGETAPPISSLNMKPHADRIVREKPCFSYFLDGSRRTFKVDDIAYKNQVFPVIAGQVGVGCCMRINKEMKPFDFERRLVITLPKVANQEDWRKKEMFFTNLKKKVNANSRLQVDGLEFTDILSYQCRKEEGEKLESKGIAVIQDLMISCEVNMVSKLVANGKINYENYLLKDGSLEYKVDHLKSDREIRKFKSNFRWVVGASKSFNPENCKDKRGKNNSNVIADLPLFHRTPVNMYSSPRLDGMKYAIWYVRIREKKYTTNAFDGVLKIEKILVTDNQIKNGLDTDEVDLITSNIVNERNPVCYGSDFRWANHLYPVYVTERFAKSKYLSNTMFLNLF